MDGSLLHVNVLVLLQLRCLAASAGQNSRLIALTCSCLASRGSVCLGHAGGLRWMDPFYVVLQPRGLSEKEHRFGPRRDKGRDHVLEDSVGKTSRAWLLARRARAQHGAELAGWPPGAPPLPPLVAAGGGCGTCRSRRLLPLLTPPTLLPPYKTSSITSSNQNRLTLQLLVLLIIHDRAFSSPAKTT